MRRPDLNEILKPLKPFQLNTVNHAFNRLFVDSDSSSRFLVADEVGLGKTLVARGIIGRTIDHLWNDVDRIDIVYICSNAGIARANLPKLRIGDTSENSFAKATRLTMLATELAPQDGRPGFLANKLNFVSFTPKTSFEMGNASGQRTERELLFHLLSSHVPHQTALMNLLQGGVANKYGWRRGLIFPPPIEPGIRHRFDAAMNNDISLKCEIDETIDRWFRRFHRYPPEARHARNSLIGKLRQVLAGVCLEVLEPDLVILDEFQRFKPLIETHEDQLNEAAELAQSLFQAQAHDNLPVRTLLLSATPYKLYTMDAEIGSEDHYSDFFATTNFLFNGRKDLVEELELRLTHFATDLKSAASGNQVAIDRARCTKKEVENILCSVMSRTERVVASKNRDAMVVSGLPSLTINSKDVEQYLASDALFQAVGDRDPMPLWKSAPYLTHFMHGYKFNERLADACIQTPETVVDVLSQHQRAFLASETVENWSKFDPANSKLRMIVEDHLDDGLWRMLWLPPTLPYWPLEGPFRNKHRTTKTLMFSAWNVVPDVISAYLSYEAERRMSKGRIDKYHEPGKQQAPLLRFTHSATGGRSRHRLLLLLMPCIALSDEAHPLSAPDGYDRRRWVRARVKDLLSKCIHPNSNDIAIDERWEWVAPLVLDPGLRSFLQSTRNDGFPAFSVDSNHSNVSVELFDHLDDLLSIDLTELGRPPPNLPDLLTEVALGAPSILALRSLKMSNGVADNTRRRLACMVGNAFWSLFNQPAVISLIRQLTTSRDETAYWRLVLEYCRKGNLQAVLDEQWHILWEQHSWSEGRNPDLIASECTQELVQAIHPVRSRVHGRFFNLKGSSRIESHEIRIRTVYALRFGHLRSENGENISQDVVRSAFNSPFRPFVLTSTSIGQEGLDFHPWCHRLVHRNLPGNPVDLEQREGRVHRYKGHAVRRNVAEAYGMEALESWRLGDDLWELIFCKASKAARDTEDSDLVPYWIANGNTYIEREVPLLPYSNEVEQFKRLKRQLAIYRVVFGQPRQEELLNLLDKSSMTNELIEELTINLSPPGDGLA